MAKKKAPGCKHPQKWAYWQKAEKIVATEKSADYPFLIRDKDQIYLQWQTEVEGFRLINVN